MVAMQLFFCGALEIVAGVMRDLLSATLYNFTMYTTSPSAHRHSCDT